MKFRRCSMEKFGEKSLPRGCFQWAVEMVDFRWFLVVLTLETSWESLRTLGLISKTLRKTLEMIFGAEFLEVWKQKSNGEGVVKLRPRYGGGREKSCLGWWWDGVLWGGDKNLGAWRDMYGLKVYLLKIYASNTQHHLSNFDLFSYKL